MNTSRNVLAVLVFLVLFITGCNPSDNNISELSKSVTESTSRVTPVPTATPTLVPTAVPTPTPTPLPTPTPTPSRVVASLDKVKNATIRIESQGSFVDPENGASLIYAGHGSGFIIDESGIAVTNNHVVTGAAFLKVWVGAEDEPRNATILGVSECSDLAIIDIDGDDFAYLEWYAGDIWAGLNVYAAGYPFGDPEFTLTRGIISKEHANGQSSWASVEAVVEHDATINPGSSGGPLVTQDGQAVAVNYAGNQEHNQYFAIARDEALGIINQLLFGQDVASIGVNGLAVDYGEGLTGIWVSSVQSGSPVDKAGVQGGDIITTIEGLPIATDGTMTDYCHIVRSHQPDDALSIEVVRLETDEVLKGQINGDRLEVVSSYGPQYVTIVDQTDTIQVEVPQDWSDIVDLPWSIDDETVGVILVASPNIDDFLGRCDTPGIIFGASDTLASRYNESQFLDWYVGIQTDRTYDGRYTYDDGMYAGVYDRYTDCGGTDTTITYLAAMPADRSYLTFLIVQTVTEADEEALDHILASFYVHGYLATAGQLSTTAGWDAERVRYPMVLTDTAGYHLWYSAGDIGCATSPDGLNWTRPLRKPILTRGAPGEWDGGSLESPYVLKRGERDYLMWYSGFGPSCGIGLATSSDGLNWTKHPDNPVLTAGTDRWNNVCIVHPSILFEDGIYKMWLQVQGDDGGGLSSHFAYITSSDGINWEWQDATLLFGTSWEGWIWRPFVLPDGEGYQMWYSAWANNEASMSYASATDEITWTKLGRPILQGTAGTWDEGWISDTYVLIQNGAYTMWYDNEHEIGVATSSNGIDWTKSASNPVLQPAR